MKIVMLPSTKKVLFLTGTGDSGSVFLKKLHSLTGRGYSDFITREHEKNHIPFTEASLANWANHLFDEGKPEQLLEIYEWMEKNKMTFSQSVLANYLDLVCEGRGITGGQDCYRKLDPDFHTADTSVKNWSAYEKILQRINGVSLFLGQETFANITEEVETSLVFLMVPPSDDTMGIEKCGFGFLCRPKENNYLRSHSIHRRLLTPQL